MDDPAVTAKQLVDLARDSAQFLPIQSHGVAPDHAQSARGTIANINQKPSGIEPRHVLQTLRRLGTSQLPLPHSAKMSGYAAARWPGCANFAQPSLG